MYILLSLILAAKLALNMFAHEKSTTPRERDLVRILKVSYEDLLGSSE